MKCPLWLIAVFFFLLEIPAGAEFYDLKRCQEHYQEFAQSGMISHLTKEQKDFIQQTLLPISGGRIFFGENKTLRPWTVRPARNGFAISGFGEGNDITFKWVEDLSRPEFRIHDSGNRTISIPKGFDFSSEPLNGQKFFVRALRGHSLQPFIKSETAGRERLSIGESELNEKTAQREGINAALGAFRQGDDAFLYVATTATGKTLVIQEALKGLLDANNQALRHQQASGKTENIPSIHIVFNDREPLVDQLYKNMQNIDSEYLIYHWGGGKESANTPKTIQELTERAQKSGKPIVLVTTIQTLVGRVGKNQVGDKPADPRRERNIELLKENVATFVIDEAHHGGAPQTIDLIDAVRGVDRAGDNSQTEKNTKPRAKYLGVTATPTRRDMDLINHVFHGNAFFANIDNAKGYLENRGKADRSITEILDQLRIAIDRGEAHPFRTWFMDPSRFHEGGDPLHIKEDGKGKPYELNPKHYENFINGIRPILEKNDHIFFANGSINEATLLAKYFAGKNILQANGKPFTVGILHSSLDKDRPTGIVNPDGSITFMKKEDIKKAFEQGKISALFTVGMLDEGIDIPNLTAYIDTNREIDPKELIQRIGRTLRQIEGKIKRSDIVSFQKVKDTSTAEALLALHDIGVESWGEASGGGGSGGKGKGVAEIPEEFALPIMWTNKDLEQAKDSFFTRDRQHNEQKEAAAQDESSSIFTSIFKLNKSIGSFDGMALPAPPAVIKAHNKLTQLLDQGGLAERYFRENLEKASPQVKQMIQSIIDQRTRWKEKAKTKEGIIEVMKEFSSKYKRAPQSENCTDDEKYLREMFLEHYANNTSDWNFKLDELSEKVLEQLGVTGNRRYILNEPASVLENAFVYYQKHGKPPKSEARGFEGEVAQKISKMVNSNESELSKDKFEDLIGEMLIKHPKAEEYGFGVLSQYEKSLKESANLEQTAQAPATTTTPQAQTKKEKLLDLLKDPAKRTGLKSAGKPSDAVVLRLQGGTVGAQRLVDFYKTVATGMGLSLKVNTLQKNREIADFELTISRVNGSPQPSYLFGHENGNHTVTFMEGNDRRTNDVRVEVVGYGAPPKRNDPSIRKLQLLTGKPMITDIRANGGKAVELSKDPANVYSDLYLQILSGK